MQINQLPSASSLNLQDKFAVDATDGVTKSITASQLRDLIRTNSYGAPLEASTVAGMTDTSKVYVYTGSETGYTNGNWYYYNGTAWVSGGAYNSVAVDTDTTLSLSGVAADAKATGDAIAAADTALSTAIAGVQTNVDKIYSDTATAYENLEWPVSTGQYCLYAGFVYKANQDIPTIESWNPYHWTQTNLGEGLSNLSDVQGDIDDLQGAIVTERLARQTADTSLNNAISAEATAREQAVAAEATAREAADNDIKSAIYKTQAVDFPITTGYLSHDSGVIIRSGTGFKISDYISLANVHRIVCYSGSAYNYVAAIAFYEQQKTYINSVTLTKGTVIANMEDFPSDAYYARICVSTDDSAAMYSIDTMEQKIQSVINSDREEKYDVNFIKGRYIQLTNGEEASSADWKVSPFIDVDDLYSVTVKSIRHPSVSYISFYDSTKSYIFGVLPTSETEIVLYKGNFPQNTKYVRLCISDVDTTAYCYYTYANNSFKNTLKYMCFGDSIISDEVCGIGTLIAQELNAIQLGNFAHGNATLSDWHTGDVNDTVETPDITPDMAYNANVLSNQVRNALAYATETGQPVTYTHPVAGTITLDTSIWTGTGSSENVPDIIYIAIGTNDGRDDCTPVVNNADTVNQQTYADLNRCSYASSLRWALETLIAKFPYAEIYVATPLHTAEHRMNGKRSYDIMNLKADLIKNVCRFCSVNVIDSYAESGVSSAMQGELFGSDGLHPVTKWRDYIARFVANKIRLNYIQRP